MASCDLTSEDRSAPPVFDLIVSCHRSGHRAERKPAGRSIGNRKPRENRPAAVRCVCASQGRKPVRNRTDFRDAPSNARRRKPPPAFIGRFSIHADAARSQ